MSSLKNKNIFWNFAQEEGNTEEATLFLDGEIASEQSWWYDTITPAQFTRDLQGLGDVKKINVHLNSGGGDVFAAHTIATRLKDHGAKIIVKISWAASAATIIAAAADKTLIPAGGVYMIHNPKMCPCGYFEAKDFIKMADKLEVIKNSIVEWYVDKTGKEKKDICGLMDDETWWTGTEAVENGFCDELMFNDTVQAVIEDKNKFVFNNVALDLKNYENIPEKIKGLFKPVSAAANGNAAKQNMSIINSIIQKGGIDVEIRNVEDLRKAFPEFVTEIENTAAKTATSKERERIKNIEEVTLAGYEEMAATAKFEKPTSAEALSMAIITAQKEEGKNFLKNNEVDVTNSGVNNIGTAPSAIGAKNTINNFDAVIDQVLPEIK